MAEAHDPGGKVRTKLPPGMCGWATFSECGRYRRALGREWGEIIPRHPGYVLWIGMNPSTADADVNDPTITREIRFTKRWGYGAMVKCNVGDYRATDPRALSAPGINPCTMQNFEEIMSRAQSAALIVFAHGELPLPLIGHGRRITDMLLGSPLADRIYCLGKTKGGWPRHPSRIANAVELERYEGRRS